MDGYDTASEGKGELVSRRPIQSPRHHIPNPLWMGMWIGKVSEAERKKDPIHPSWPDTSGPSPSPVVVVVVVVVATEQQQ